MHRRFVYATTAVLTFLFGLIAFQTGLTINTLEARFRQWLDTAPTLRATAELPLMDEQADANQVYRAIIETKFIKKGTRFLLIDKKTTRCGFFEDNESAAQFGVADDFVSRVKARMPEADSATIEDYFSKNTSPTNILVSDLGIDYRLVAGWSGAGGYYAKPVESNEYIHLSRVGFNPQRDQAFVVTVITGYLRKGLRDGWFKKCKDCGFLRYGQADFARDKEV
jgi:hypothetical protein